MSLTFSGPLPVHTVHTVHTVRPVRRVRHEVRDGMAVIAFSAVASSGLAAALMLFLSLVA